MACLYVGPNTVARRYTSKYLGPVQVLLANSNLGINPMFINREDLPSRSTDVETVSIPAYNIMMVKSKRDLLGLAWQSVISPDRDLLTMQDLHFILVMHRMSVSDINTLAVRSTCSYPVFLIDREGQPIRAASLTSMSGSDVVVGTVPCEGKLYQPITPLDLKIKFLPPELEPPHPDFQLPSASDLEFYESGSRVNWMLMHLKPEARTPAALSAEGKDAEYLAGLARWVTDSDHGLVSELVCQCPDCGRLTSVNWDIEVS